MRHARTIKAIVGAELAKSPSGKTVVMVPPEQVPPERRAEMMRVGAVATATGRTRTDVLRSLMVCDVVGLPARFAGNVTPDFRAELHGSTSLSKQWGRR